MVRHGQTDWNTEKRYQGHVDTALNAVGRRQAEALARHFAGQPIAAIYSSDLQRAFITAQTIGGAVGIEPRREPRLREGSFGAWEGLTSEEIRQRWPQEYTAYLNDPLTHSAPEGESLRQLTARVGAALHDITQNHSSETVMVVAHGGTLRALICHAMKLPPHVFWRLAQESACISELQLFDDYAVLMLLNDRHIVQGISQEQGFKLGT